MADLDNVPPWPHSFCGPLLSGHAYCAALQALWGPGEAGFDQ